MNKGSPIALSRTPQSFHCAQEKSQQEIVLSIIKLIPTNLPEETEQQRMVLPIIMASLSRDTRLDLVWHLGPFFGAMGQSQSLKAEKEDERGPPTLGDQSSEEDGEMLAFNALLDAPAASEEERKDFCRQHPRLVESGWPLDATLRRRKEAGARFLLEEAGGDQIKVKDTLTWASDQADRTYRPRPSDCPPRKWSM